MEGEAEETGSTLEENSLLKAKYISDRIPQGVMCFADDSGLEVDALDGAPGVYTARYAGPQCDFDDNMDKLLRELALRPEKARTARFVCVVTLINGDVVRQFRGVLEGQIALEKRGGVWVRPRVHSERISADDIGRTGRRCEKRHLAPLQGSYADAWGTIGIVPEAHLMTGC